ncbi:unnamed protein product [Paramecium pentaurelia]|uniref:Uncharacterized protein n=1 Tax=Paramecium pentaurelia TaxID=43138 RepID=A0A8S1TGC3_9CILI|nr:unnamed protein product [Paramecium pentaurelia]
MKQNKRAAQYKKKPSQEQKQLIILQLILKIKTITELVMEYELSKSTIYSYLNAKGPMYQPLETAIQENMRKWLNMSFQRLNSYKCDRLVRKDIIFYLQMEEFFQNSDSNPFQSLIPISKMNSKRFRLFQKLLQFSLAYFESLKTNQASLIQQPIDQSIVIENNNLQVNQELITQNNQMQETETYIEYESLEELMDKFRDHDSYSFC